MPFNLGHYVLWLVASRVFVSDSWAFLLYALKWKSTDTVDWSQHYSFHCWIQKITFAHNLRRIVPRASRVRNGLTDKNIAAESEGVLEPGTNLDLPWTGTHTYGHQDVVYIVRRIN